MVIFMFNVALKCELISELCAVRNRTAFVMLKENVLMLIPLILDGQNQTDKLLNNCPLYFCSKLNKILESITFL